MSLPSISTWSSTSPFAFSYFSIALGITISYSSIMSIVFYNSTSILLTTIVDVSQHQHQLALAFQYPTQSQCTNIFNTKLCLLFDHPCLQIFFIHCTSHAICKFNWSLLIRSISPSFFSSLRLPKHKQHINEQHKSIKCCALLMWVGLEAITKEKKRSKHSSSFS